MTLERYNYTIGKDGCRYEFFSEGPKGVIKKVVLYDEFTELEDKAFNLAFGDWDEINDKINDHVISNNMDTKKVLATVAATVLHFTEHHPDAIIFAIGSFLARTRLYQIGIVMSLWEISNLFDLQGFKDYSKDPYFIKKHEQALAFLKKAGIPEDFKKKKK